MQGTKREQKHTVKQIVEAPPKKKANKHTAEQIVELSKRKRIRKKEAKKELIKKKFLLLHINYADREKKNNLL